MSCLSWNGTLFGHPCIAEFAVLDGISKVSKIGNLSMCRVCQNARLAKEQGK